MNRRTGARWGALLVLVSASLASAACGSASIASKPAGAIPPFPADADPCAAYCLVWVPPVYRDVPEVIPGCGKCVDVTLPATKVVYEEVCKPGCYQTRQIPDRCRHNAIVQVSPPHEEWVPVACGATGPCGCSDAETCWKRVVIPGDYKVCETVETEKGIQYCAFTPPEREVVAKTVRCDVKHSQYVPAEAKVCWHKECIVPGHYEWKVRYDCATPMMPPLKTTCVPCSGCGCVPCDRGDFTACPPKD
jgi:hypothetical protein